MCLHRSYVVTEDLKILKHPTSDHHTFIRKEHKIGDGLHQGEFGHASVEYRPIRNLFDLGTWEFLLDERVKPSWWTKEHESKTQKQLEKDFLRYTALDSTYIFPGDLDLNALQDLQPNTTIIAGGCIYLNSIRVIPPQVTLIAKTGGIAIESVRDCYHEVTIVAPSIIVMDRSILRRANVSTNGDRCKRPDLEFDHRARYNTILSYQSLGQTIQGYNGGFQP